MNTEAAVDEFTLRAIWWTRAESADKCAERLEACLKRLADCDQAYSRWFPPTDASEKQFDNPVPVEHEQLQELIVAKNIPVLAEIDKPEGATFNAMVRCWNKQPDGSGLVSFSLYCGDGACAAGKLVNSFALDIPRTSQERQRIPQTSVLERVVRAVVTSWEPDFADVASRKYLMRRNGDPANKPEVHWFTYLSKRRGTVPPLERPWRVVPIEDLGTLIILDVKRFDGKCPDHIGLLDRLRNILEEKGLLEPIDR